MRTLYSILFRSYIVLALVPLVLLGIMLTVWIASGQIAASYRQEQSMARHVAHDLKRHFSALEEKLFSLNQFRNFTTVSDVEAQHFAKELVARQNSICSLVLLDGDGRIRCRVSSSKVYDSSEPLGAADSALFEQTVSAGKVTYGRVYEGGNCGGRILQVGVPLKDRMSGKTGVVLLADFRLSTAWRDVTEQNFQDGESLFLVGADGQVLAHPNPSFVLAKKKALSIDDGKLRKNISGDYVIGAYSELSLGNLTFRVVAERLAETALVPAMRSAGVALLATILTAGLVFIATLRTARRITRPVKLLTEAALNIKDQSFYPGITIGGFEEIADLSQAFDSMTRNLQRMLEELEHEIQIRKDSEEALSLSEERFRSMFEFNSVAMLLIDPENGRILEANNAASRFYGWSVEEMTSFYIGDINVAGHAALRERMKKVVDGEISRFEFQHRLADGRICDVDVYTGPIPLEGKHVVFSSIIDITKRKEAERELQDSEERFRALHNASFGGIAIHEQGLILDCNQGLAEVSGYGIAELEGLDITRLIAEKSRAVVEKNIRDGVEKAYEANGIHKDGTEYPVHLESRNIPYQGRVVQVLEFRDLTDQKRAEEFIIQNEKMMSLGGLAAGMAHEINNPLAAIVGSCQNLQNRLLKDIPKNRAVADECGISFDHILRYAEARDCDNMVQSIYESGKRAADIVKDMLSFSRRNEKSLISNKITELMDNTLKLVSNDYDLKKNYDFKKIKIVREYEDGNSNVVCYSNQIQQVFFNLLKNAAHAMSEKEYIDDAPRIIIRSYSRNAVSFIEVEDNGTGLAEGAKQRVFEPFFSTKSPGKGTGLGLSVSYFIVVKQHCGSMEVVSEPGKWTRFVISLPMEGPQSQEGIGEA
ncbi:PAS domain S-box protein [Desulfovibrio sp. JC010]|uniref:PAS domain S-box protein n=1 Tax=Desulfovibrio sp. JC010 TaxID=2593641 RepID=UPI0013D039EC|nr:PAS domain S-box protein [Desulfovibrio sp. JC010]NDV26972.1 PAS domain S-box protein [Desulfovibrio sp. JC010]